MSHPIDWLTNDSLLLYQSELLKNYANRLIYGFTGKPLSVGGQSHPPETIRAQRQWLCQEMQIDFGRLIVPDQVHSTTIKTSQDSEFGDTDAVIINRPGVAAMIQVADCVPILLYDADHHVGAVIHAGWRGTAASITPKVVERMRREFGCTPQQMIAVLGPAISGPCYEVSPEVGDALRLSLPPHIPNDSYETISPNNRPQIDLKTVNMHQLRSVGVHLIDNLPHCTYAENDRFWSYRRGDNGRQGVILQLCPTAD